MIIISAHITGVSKTENANRQTRLLEKLLAYTGFDAKVTQATGKFEGIEEECFAVEISESASDDTCDRIAEGIRGLAEEFNQIAIGAIQEIGGLPVMACISSTWNDEDVTYNLLNTSETEPEGDYLHLGSQYLFPGDDLSWYIDYLEMLED